MHRIGYVLAGITDSHGYYEKNSLHRPTQKIIGNYSFSMMPTKKQPHGSIEENFAPVPIHRVINLILRGIIPMYGFMAQLYSLRPTIFVLEGYWKLFFLYRPTMHRIRYIFARFTDFHGY